MQKTIEVNGRQLTFSPLNLRGIRVFEETFHAIRDKKVTGISAVLATVPLVHQSLKKAHPDMTVEELEEILTVGDLDAVQTAMLEVSELVITAKNTGEEVPVAG